MHIDLFCQVVDNFGDAGVCWRLARQLVGECGASVRLWIDAPDCLQRLWPAIETGLESQTCAGVAIHHWPADFPATPPGDVVIEAFGCALPASFVAAMAAKRPPPVWINLEYLSAEAWVEGCHGLPSPHPRLALTKHFFFPGFTRQTGGLPRERDLSLRRDEFRASPPEANQFLGRLGVEQSPGRPLPMLVSLFSYENPALPGLVAAWAGGDEEILCLVPEGSRPGVLDAFGLAAQLGATTRQGRLSARIVPFVSQDDYDRLLWTCDLNFVRGEDSFLRAQWAARPFVWQAYPQAEATHHLKLAAFLDRYLAGLDAETAAAARAMFEAWNGARGFGDAWSHFAAVRRILARHGEDWDRRLAGQTTLVANLASFCISKLK